MTIARAAVLRPDDWVQYPDGEHEVIALAGTTVRLRSGDRAEQAVLAGYLLASPGFEVTGRDALPEVEPFALLDSLPAEVVAAAREWERLVVEVETGLPPGVEPGATPRPGYDPTSTTLLSRSGEGHRTGRQRPNRAGPALPLRPAGCGA